jgi:hypothetical protein
VWEEVSETTKVLQEIRATLAPSDRILREARKRRTRVLTAARAFQGIRDSYNSGSIAHGTANSDLDADCGIVLDRRTYPDLGPDGDGDGPNELLSEFRDFVADTLAEEDEGIEVRLTKRRAVKASFHQEVDGADPSVDLVMALERKSAPGIWIPNRPEDAWDPAHPAKHTELFTLGAADLVRTRARAVRLMKGWNTQYANPGLSSFNIEALAWECIEEATSEAEALAELFTYAAKELAGGETDDPAGVSGAIRLLIDQGDVVARLEKAAELLRQAVDQDEDEEAVREALAGVFWDYVTPAEGSTSKAAYADALRRGKTVSVGESGLSIGAAAGTKPLKRTRSYGDGPGR